MDVYYMQGIKKEIYMNTYNSFIHCIVNKCISINSNDLNQSIHF